ncbi:SigE family RNA polymerase sigma factor [Actinocorallia sp. A-T 12471]|uniref:RNA polymerase sigma factor n=1 Tax=Actinocorallia sp. A-T 12471 TaxID=3089813 RepID=UPI0029D1D9D0|nr:SigE family RNA polymerase sigma factor [Actinocorallia sp. A-T 12471]MDX6739779.1 SigE family RNA polymerase sigma factor [Actinocorallia sp. A-T 12471]
MTADTTAPRRRPDEASFAALYREHSLGLTRLAFLMLGDRESAQDVVQEAFLGLYKRWPSLRDPTKALSYARSSVLNRCRSVLRKRRLPFFPTPELFAFSAESEALLDESRREVLKALHNLPPRQREALILRYFLDLSEAETATTMNITRGTAKSTVSRALTALSHHLEPPQ